MAAIDTAKSIPWWRESTRDQWPARVAAFTLALLLGRETHGKEPVPDPMVA